MENLNNFNDNDNFLFFFWDWLSSADLDGELHLTEPSTWSRS